MDLQQQYFDHVAAFLEVQIPDWLTEIEQQETYITKAKAEGKNVLFFEIKLNKNIQRLEQVKQLIEAASTAVSTIPKATATHTHSSHTAPQQRQRIIDMPISDSWKIDRLLTLFENQYLH